jgi:SAM-dependent methyltransferase
MDVWGAIYVDHLEGRVLPHSIERDDGLEHQVPSALAYFKAPRSDLERTYLDALRGPGLDVGAGAGSHARYLEARGLAVTAVDSSQGAVDVCRRRGCQDARLMDLRNLDLQPGHFSAIIVMGNTLGVHQTPATLPVLLRQLAMAARSGGHLFSVMLDPLDTNDPVHLRYHQQNRDRGRPPGMSVIRLKYRGLVDDWVSLWMPTRDEFRSALNDSGWSLVDEQRLGPHRFRLLERGPGAV